MHSICMCHWYRVCPVQASDTSASAAIRQVKHYAKASELPCKTYGSTQSDPAEVGDGWSLGLSGDNCALDVHWSLGLSGDKCEV